jgi:hypothetical protein
MAVSSAALKLGRLRRRFGISAPRVAVRAHVAWYWRALFAIFVLTLSFLLAVWVYDAGRRFAGYGGHESAKELQSLRNYVMELDSELTRLRGQAGSGLQMEQAALRQLSAQVRSLELENAVLKQDLAFFEELVPSAELGESGVRINNLQIEAGSRPGEYRYRMLVVNNGARLSREVRMVLQLGVETRRSGKDAIITVPSGVEQASSRFRFEIKRFYRLEGGFSVPPDAIVRRVEVRLLQEGEIRVKQSVTL